MYHICENCKTPHIIGYGSGRFCGPKCARGFSTKNKRGEINQKVAKKLEGIKHSTERTAQKVVKYMATCASRPPLEPKKRSDEQKQRISDGLKRHHLTEKAPPSKPCRSCGSPSSVRAKNMMCGACQKQFLTAYRVACRFKFNVYHYPHLFDLDLLQEVGWYSASNRGSNLDGLSRDHLLSVREAFLLGVDPAVVSHPANCALVRHRANQVKHSKSSITLAELNARIASFRVV